MDLSASIIYEYQISFLPVSSTERGFQEKFPLAELLSNKINITGTKALFIALGKMIISGTNIAER